MSKEIKKLDFVKLKNTGKGPYALTSIIREYGCDDLDYWSEQFGHMFFGGAELPPISSALTKEERAAGKYIFSMVGSSWDTKHEHKEEACAIILSNLCGKRENMPKEFFTKLLKHIRGAW